MKRKRVVTSVGPAVLALLLAGCAAPKPDHLRIEASSAETGWWTIAAVDQEGEVETAQSEAADGPSATRVPSDILFQFDSSAIRQEHKDLLTPTALQITARGQAVMIAGHTDDTGDASHNFGLGADRAMAIRLLLVELGVPMDLILDTISYGEDCPLESNATQGGRAANRRVEIFTPDFDHGCRRIDMSE